jgi:GNAT superfamily N-acetyltransferase
MTIHPIARLPDKWIEQARKEHAHIDLTLKSPWQLFAAFDGSTSGGFIGVLLIGSATAHVRGWYVFPDQRNQGIGGQLLDHALNWCRLNGYHHIDIRTAHNLDWTGFTPTGYQRQHGQQEAQYVLDLVA